MDQTSRGRPATAAVWSVALATLGVAALLATSFGLMAAALDPTEIVTAGIEPWTNAALAALAFGAVTITTVLSLVLWHSRRLWSLGAAMAVLQEGVVGWACARFYAEYL